MQSIIYFERTEPLQGLFDKLFGGFYLVKGAPLIGQLALLLFAFAALYYASQPKRKQLWRASALFSVLFFSVVCLFLLQPWDELFINLRHSWNWAMHGRFSFNPSEWIEGTVDTLPYLAVGFAGRLGLPIVEAGFLMSYIGGLACLYQATRLFHRICPTAPWPYFLFALCLYPPLAFNSAHGFATALFSATILFAIRCMFFEGRVAWGITALASLPLIRFEGSFFALLLLSLWVYRFRVRSRTTVIGLLSILVPALVHALIRIKYFGEAVPLPVQFKSTSGNLFYLAVGIRNWLADFSSTFCMVFVFAFTTLRIALKQTASSQDSSIRKSLLLTLGACTLPYYFSGGDWFPSYWARYLLPFVLVLLTFFASFAYEAHQKLPIRIFCKALAAPILLAGLTCLWPISSGAKWIEAVFSHRRTLAMVQEPTIARGHYRIHSLSQLGELLRLTTLNDDRIGTSELATLHFFSQRPGVDFLGLMNKEIAQSPLRQSPAWLRKFPYRSELPFLIFKRLDPTQLQKHRPEILYTFDFMLRDQIPELRAYELDKTSLLQALARWEKQMSGMMDSLYGGLSNIKQLGYTPVVIRAGDGFTALYFVQASVLERHKNALIAQGFQRKL